MSAERIAQVLFDAQDGGLIGAIPSLLDEECDGSKFHSPRPLLLRPVHLSIEVDRVAGVVVHDKTCTLDDVVYLCGTCEDNLSTYLTIRYAYAGATPRTVRRDFGNAIRALGDRAWEYHMKRSTLVPV